jgi:hypothetical protein
VRGRNVVHVHFDACAALLAAAWTPGVLAFFFFFRPVGARGGGRSFAALRLPFLLAFGFAGLLVGFARSFWVVGVVPGWRLDNGRAQTLEGRFADFTLGAQAGEQPAG